MRKEEAFGRKDMKQVAKTISGVVEKKAQVMEVLMGPGDPDEKREKCRHLRSEQRAIRAEQAERVHRMMGVSG